MAESVTNVRYYCHQCSEEINPKEDFTCPSCEMGFIEEVNERFEEEQFTDSVASSMNTVLSRIMPMLASGGRSRESDNPRDSDDDTGFTLGFPRFPIPVETTSTSAGPSNGGGSNAEDTHFESLFNGPGPAGLDTLVQQLITNLIGNTAGLSTPGFLPGDYVIGQSAFDNIVTQLMNQLEPSGPAPATAEQIKSLDSTTISQEQVDENLQCSVCFEEFKLTETVNKLPCTHLFHPDCIKPWLERHGTCPICRKTLSGEDTSTMTDNGRNDPLQNSSLGSLPRMPQN